MHAVLILVRYIDVLVCLHANQRYSVYSEEISNIEILLKLVMEFFPSSATKVFKVAQRLANALIDQSENTSGPGAPAHKNCHRGTQLLADLGESLAKYMYAHIPDFQEKDTTHSTWDELPTIMTPKEIFTGKTKQILIFFSMWRLP